MKKTFTLIELIVVIAILSLLATIVIPNVQNVKKDAVATNIQSTIRTLQTAADIYSIEHNGTLPTVQKPTIEKPQKVDLDMLYPEYIKGEMNNPHNYWIDYTGKVWGSSIEAPSNFFESDRYIEWKNNKEAKQYRIYEVVDNQKTSDVVHTKIVDLATILGGKEDVIQLEKEPKTYLISSVDQYNLETVPVGLTYQESQDWFKSIQSEEGTFSFEIIRDKDMIFEGYQVEEDKPEGTNISYAFATEQDHFTNFVDNIEELPPTKHVKIQITTTSYNGKYPSLYSMNVFFHFEGENQKALSVKPISSIPTSIPHQTGNVYQGQLSSDERILNVYRPQETNGFELWYVDGSVWKKASSLSEVPSGSIFYIWVDTQRSSSNPNTYPIVVTAPHVTVNQVNKNNEEQPVDTTEPKEKWNTIQTLTFLVSAKSDVKWLRAEYDQDIPVGTQIEYLFSTSKGSTWSTAKTNIADLERAPLLRVTANLQQKSTLEDKSITPKIKSIRIYNDEGYVDPPINKPSVEFNNPMTSYHVGSIISWDYTVNDPTGNTISNVEWSGNKQDSYSTEGNVRVGVRVQNSEGVWSDWTYKDIVIADFSNIQTSTPTNKPFYFENGTASYVMKSTITNFPTQAFTVEFGVRFGVANKHEEYVFSYANSMTDNEVLIGYIDGKIEYHLQNEVTITTIPVKPNEMHYYSLAVNKIEGTVYLYEDGKLVWSENKTFARDFKSGGTIVLGQDQDSVGGGFNSDQSVNGFIDDVRLWKVQLPETVVKSYAGKSITSSSTILISNISTRLDTQEQGFVFNRITNYALDQSQTPYFNYNTNSAVIQRETNFPSTKWTISFWMNEDKASTSNQSFIFSYATAAQTNGILIGEKAGKLIVYVNGVEFDSTVSVPLKTWTHISVTWISSNGLLSIYKDGVLAQTTTISKSAALSGTGCVVLGQDQDAVCGGFENAQSYNGQLKNVSVYENVLTSSEILSLKNDSLSTLPFRTYLPSSLTVVDLYLQNGKGMYQNLSLR